MYPVEKHEDAKNRLKKHVLSQFSLKNNKFWCIMFDKPDYHLKKRALLWQLYA